MAIIERDVYLLQRRRIAPIDIVYGSAVPIRLNMLDCTIPENAAIEFFARHGDGPVYRCAGSAEGSAATFTPPEGFFQPGDNALQLEINGKLIPLTLAVKCEERISNIGSEETPEMVKPYVTQCQEILAENKTIAVKTPYVGENGNWYVYDAAGKSYVDSGVDAAGPKGDAFTYSDFSPEQLAELIGKVSDNSISRIKHGLFYINDGGKRTIKAMVSFIDDDCRSEAYDILFPVIRSLGIPYTLACPPGSIGKPDFMTREQLAEMISAGVTVSSHHVEQSSMASFASEDDYDDELVSCDALFSSMGINVKSVCYPGGIYVDDYIRTVKKHYKMGFTVDRGINHIPYASYFMKRCEVFPRGGEYTLDDAKAYVDQVATDGGWLIFMTHAWYPSFSAQGLTDLVSYTREKGIPIVDVNTAIDTTGNIIDIGHFKKPLEDVSTPFFVVDSTGGIWTNALNLVNRSAVKITVINAAYYTGCYLKPAGGKSDHSDAKRIVSVDVAVMPGDRYRLSCSAVYGGLAYGVYSVGDDRTTLTLITDAGDNGYYAVENDADGEVLTDKEITIPANAAYLRVSSNLHYQPEGFVIKKVTYV